MVSVKKPTAGGENSNKGSQNGEQGKTLLFDRPLAADWHSRVESDPHRPGTSRARLLEPGVPVWSIVGYLRALEPDFSARSIDAAAVAFNIPVTDVTAAIAYYLQHREAIDALLALHADV